MPTNTPRGSGQAGLSEHEADSVDAVASFHREHYGAATPLQRVIDWTTALIGRPAGLLLIVAIVASWTAYAAVAGHGEVDQPAFAWLELAATLSALLIALMILVTQRREDQLAERRAKLTLELALLADKKMAKTISLLEELRRDAPDLTDRHDGESADMATPANPVDMMAAIEERADEIVHPDSSIQDGKAV
jgi:uncharacterized membrane protein